MLYDVAKKNSFLLLLSRGVSQVEWWRGSLALVSTPLQSLQSLQSLRLFTLYMCSATARSSLTSYGSSVFVLLWFCILFGAISSCQNNDGGSEATVDSLPPVVGNHTGSQINGLSQTHTSSSLGINVESFSSQTPTSILLDVFSKSVPWVSNICDKNGWGTGPTLDLDDHGWVRTLAENQCADTFLYSSNKQTYPWGEYVLIWKGEGVVTVSGDIGTSVVVKTSEMTKRGDDSYRLVFTIDESARSNVGIAIRLSDLKSDYVHDMRLIVPGGVCKILDGTIDRFSFCRSARGGYGECRDEQVCQDFEEVYWNRFDDSVEDMSVKLVFHPEWARNYRPFRSIRFLKWMRPGDNTSSVWADRALPQAQSFTNDRIEIPYEYITALANLLTADIWLNLPMKSSNDYTTKMAKFFLTNLNSKPRVFLEYGNEIFNQKHAVPYSYALGQANLAESGIPSADTNISKVAKFAALHAASLFDHWDSEFKAEKNRIIRILGGDISDIRFAREGLSFVQDGNTVEKFDGIAVSAYFGPDRNDFDDPAEFDRLDTESFFAKIYGDAATERSQDALVKNVVIHKALANDYGLRLIAYEGGSNVAATGASTDVVRRFFLMHRSERMAVALYENLRKWKLAGGDLFFHFLLYDRWDENGFSGVFEFQGQSRESSFKWQKLMMFIDDNPCWWEACE